jgi:hypothetical protein
VVFYGIVHLYLFVLEKKPVYDASAKDVYENECKSLGELGLCWLVFLL